MGPARIDGNPVGLDAAAAEAARLLHASRLPVIAGLGTDIAGARAAIALARRLGGAVDHMHSGAVLHDLDVRREAGMIVTTPNQARVRGDVLLLAGEGLVDAWPQLPERMLLAPFTGHGAEGSLAPPPGTGRSIVEAGEASRGDRVGVDNPTPALRAGGSKRRIWWLCPGRGGAKNTVANAEVRTVGRDSADLPIMLAALRARVAGRPVNGSPAPAKMIDALAADLRAARFGVAVWCSERLDAPVIEMLCGLVDDLNAETRFTGLPLTPGDNVVGVMEACGWITGYPMRTGFGRDHAEHDPWRFDATRLVESGEADCAVWISAYRDAAPAWKRSVPTIALTGPEARLVDPPRVHIAVGAPGIDHDAVQHLAAIGALAVTPAIKPSGALSVAQAIARITAALPDPGGAPC
jgi:formylmethanofuran dehydrogenase subunit B